MPSSRLVSAATLPKIVAGLALALTSGLACSPESSNLEKMAKEQHEAPQESKAEEVASGRGGEAKAGEDPSSDTEGVQPPAATGGEWELDGDGIPVPPQTGAVKLLTPGADDERVTLRLALSEGTTYRVTTLGMLKLPLMEKPTGFAREEELRLSDCRGEGSGRDCLLTHAYRNYEAEPPAGTGLEGDERLVAGLETGHRVDASGLRSSETAVHGETSPQVSKQLGEVHRMYCLRLPAEPVGLGATWRDLCRMRQGGSLVTRELTWRLAKLERSEDGTRAELEYAGRVRRLDTKGQIVNGEVKGVVYFWVDAGEPHLMRERLGFVLNPANNLGTTTDLRYQFTKLDADGETVLRTDGKPFEQSPNVLNDPRSAPSGTTRDGELAIGKNKGKNKKK